MCPVPRWVQGSLLHLANAMAGKRERINTFIIYKLCQKTVLGPRNAKDCPACENHYGLYQRGESHGIANFYYGP